MTTATKIKDTHASVESPRPHLHVLADDRTVLADRMVIANDGSRAALEVGERDDERLVVEDRDGRVLFEYLPAEGRCVVHVPAGDLVLRSDTGCVDIEAGDVVRIRGRRGVDVETEDLRAKARVAEVSLEDASIDAGILRTTVHRLLQRVDVLELAAGRVVERARETYREVEELAQIRAGRIRQVAERTLHLLAGRASFKAHEDMKIKGETIHLG